MSKITKEQAQSVSDLKSGYTLGHADVAILNELARIALASLEAEPDYYVVVTSVGVWQSFCKTRAEAEFIVSKPFNPGYSIREIYTTPPAPVSVPDRSMFEKWWESEHGLPLDSWDSLRTTDGYCDDGIDGQFEAWSACRAAMLQGTDSELQRKAAIHDVLCEKYNVESLADFVDWQRNHIAELEAAPPAPVATGETAVMPDYPGYVMTQRECFDAGAKRAVPDGWVACSERMPETYVNVLLTDEHDDVCIGQMEFEDDIYFYVVGYPHRYKATHWMPLPAAPQQE
ncbi:DUF551 domain-containing protein [Enterobacter asburiae]|uniref:DUF551 domain-containing protein n=1 Tax=Enterobacter asburiae TaxID=61645 RepID=UPI003B22B771